MSNQLDLIEAYLRGEVRIKVWDCSRNSTHKLLPPVAFFLWHYLWTRENEEQESYLSMATIMKETGLAKNTIIKWRRWLLKNGWLTLPGGTAADKYETATPGAHTVMVLRVDDPTEAQVAEDEPGVQTLGGSRIEPNVYGSGSASVSDLDSDSRSTSISSSTLTIKLKRLSGQERTGKAIPFGDVPPTAGEPNTKPNPEPTATPTPVVRKPKSAPDGAPYPDGFDSWTNAERCVWLEKHKLGKAKSKCESEPKSAPVPKAPTENPLPPEPKLVRKCSECGLCIGAGCSCEEPLVASGRPGIFWNPKTKTTIHKFVPKSGSDLTAPALQGFEDDDDV